MQFFSRKSSPIINNNSGKSAEEIKKNNELWFDENIIPHLQFQEAAAEKKTVSSSLFGVGELINGLYSALGNKEKVQTQAQYLAEIKTIYCELCQEEASLTFGHDSEFKQWLEQFSNSSEDKRKLQAYIKHFFTQLNDLIIIEHAFYLTCLSIVATSLINLFVPIVGMFIPGFIEKIVSVSFGIEIAQFALKRLELQKVLDSLHQIYQKIHKDYADSNERKLLTTTMKPFLKDYHEMAKQILASETFMALPGAILSQKKGLIYGLRTGPFWQKLEYGLEKQTELISDVWAYGPCYLTAPR